VTSSGTIALLAIGFGEYLGLATGTWVSKIFSIATVLILTDLNRRDVKLGAGVMDGVTMIKILAMMILVSFGFILGHGNINNFHPFFAGNSGGAIITIGAALVPMGFA